MKKENQVHKERSGQAFGKQLQNRTARTEVEFIRVWVGEYLEALVKKEGLEIRITAEGFALCIQHHPELKKVSEALLTLAFGLDTLTGFTGNSDNRYPEHKWSEMDEPTLFAAR